MVSGLEPDKCEVLWSLVFFCLTVTLIDCDVIITKTQLALQVVSYKTLPVCFKVCEKGCFPTYDTMSY